MTLQGLYNEHHSSQISTWNGSLTTSRALVLPLDNWQMEMFSDTGTTSLFLSMCDAIEGAVGGVPSSAIPEEGVGLEKALPNFASWFKTDFIANRE